MKRPSLAMAAPEPDAAGTSDLLTATEVAAYLRVSRPTVLEWSRRGVLPCVVLHAGAVRSTRRWRRADVEAFASPAGLRAQEPHPRRQRS